LEKNSRGRPGYIDDGVVFWLEHLVLRQVDSTAITFLQKLALG
jgi:hypothetical protein